MDSSFRSNVGEKKEEIPEAQIDAMISQLQQAPLCPRCGVQLRGAPHHQPVQCPMCKNHVRHVGGLWMYYVSPLDISLAAPVAPNNRQPRFKFTR